MMTDELLNELENQDIRLSLHCGGLRATGKTVNLTEELKVELTHHRIDLMARLGDEQTPPLTVKDQLLHAIGAAVLGTDLDAVMVHAERACELGHTSREDVDQLAQMALDRSRQIPYSVEDMPLSVFAESGLVREVHSRVMDEVVLFAADNAQIPDDNSLVVYRASELRTMVGASIDMVRAVHAVKKQLDGEVIEPDAGMVEEREGERRDRGLTA